MAMECRDNLNDKWDSGEIGHECGFALLRLLKPIEYYEEKYGTHFFGLNRMYLLMEKQRNRGTDGAGVANVKLDMPPGVKYIHCEKSIDKDPIKDLFERVQLNASKKLATAPPEAVHAGSTDPWWMKEHVPYTGELFMAHVRYGTDSDNSVDRCHPVTRESNWMTRNLLLAGNFNITNNEDLFTSLVNVGQHPRELSDTVMLLERIGHYVDKENNDLYVKYSAMGHAPRTCFSLIAENLNIGRILRLASADWDGGYCIAGMFGHGDAFCLRDPNGIRPAFYLCNDEVIAVASEAPLLQTVFSVGEEQVNPLPAGEALIIRRNGQYSVERVREHRPLLQCSFERIYFSRGNDSGVYREREALGRLIFKPLLKMIEAKGDSIENTVLSFIPNTSELAYNGLVKQAQDDVVRLNGENLAKVVKAGKTGAELDAAIRAASTCAVRAEKVVHKDAKIRTFIQEDSSREHMTLHAYDVHYGTIKPEKDVLVALDDSIVRGNTLKNAILRTLDKQHPKRIIVVSSCPQIRYPDVYGIDMAKMGDLAAFKAAVTLLKERGMENVLPEVYKLCRAELACKDKGRELVNHVKRIYDQFTPDEISAKIAEQVTPSGMGAEVQILFQRIEELHEAMPDHAGDWYFSGNYPTPGGTRVCCRAFVLWMEGSTARCYGVNSAMSCVQTSVLVIGKGGAEHALACKLSHSHEVACVYVAPGNGGTLGPQQWGGESYSSAAPVIPVELSLRQPGFDNVIQFCRSNDVKMVVVGSQACLADGLADVLRTAGLQVFGPSKLAAEIESSNSFAEEFAKRHSIPKLTTNGADSQGQHNELDLSIVTLTDGVSLAVFPYTIQNFKHADQGDSGPVTDGMGAVAPSTAVSQQMLERIEQEIVRPTIKGLQSEGRPFVGCLQVELRITEKGPQVLRFRGTFSDLGAQVALPLLDHNCDLFELLSGCAAGRLEEGLLKVRDNRCVVAVVMTSGGFPGTFQAGYPIAGVDRARCVPGTHVFHNNTDRSSAQNPTTPSAFRKRRSVSGILAVEEGAQTLVTAGGPVLTVAAVGKSISEARERAYVGVRAISFKDCAYRHDIAAGPQTPHRAPLAAPSELDLAPLSPAASPARKDKEQGPTYLSAGVDNAAGAAAQSGFEPLMEKTKRAGCRTVEVPEFGPVCGSFCDMKALGYQDPVLVSASSNVGTKLEVAFKAGKHDTIGIDLVALCANDVAAQGAEPVFFHNHFATSKLDVKEALSVVQGIAQGCSEAGCALLDASTAELPGAFVRNGGNMMGFVVGVVERRSLLPKTAAMSAGNVLIALPSSGLHSNGFSLARSLIRAAGLKYDEAAPFNPTCSLGMALSTPTKIYSKAVLKLARENLLFGAAHITAGGLAGSLSSLLPQSLGARINADAWELPTDLRWLAALGKITCRELAGTFNCGLGMVFIVPKENSDRVLEELRKLHEEPLVVGELVERAAGKDAVEVERALGNWMMLPELGVSLPFPEILSSLQAPRIGARMRTAILGGRQETSVVRGLMQAMSSPARASELVALLSVDAKSTMMSLAAAAGTQATVIGNGAFASPDAIEISPSNGMSKEFSDELQKELDASKVEKLLILSDVDTSLLTQEFLEAWAGKALLVHHSLLPAFSDSQPLEAAINSGVCVTGCTVCFALPRAAGGAGPAAPRHGPIISQEHARVLQTDSVESLHERVVSECELKAVLTALSLVSEGAVALEKETYKLHRSGSMVNADDDMLYRQRS